MTTPHNKDGTGVDAAANAPITPVRKKSHLLFWLIGAMVVLVGGFMFIGDRYNIAYDMSVRRNMPHGDGTKFSGITRYKSGTVCGTVTGADGTQRFVATRTGEVVLDEIKSPNSPAYVAAYNMLCHD